MIRSLYNYLSSLMYINNFFSFLDSFLLFALNMVLLSVRTCVLNAFPYSFLLLFWNTLTRSHSSINSNVSPLSIYLTTILDSVQVQSIILSLLSLCPIHINIPLVTYFLYKLHMNRRNKQ